MIRPRIRRGLAPPALAAIVGLLGAASATQAADPAIEPIEVLRAVRSTTLDLDRSVVLQDERIPIGAAGLVVSRGVLVPTRPIDGRTVELILLGEAKLQMDAPDEIEAKQLELFTGRRVLETSVESAALVLADDARVGELLSRPRAELSDAVRDRAEQLHRSWLEKTERRTTGLEAAIFKALIGDPAFDRYFALWCESSELGEFVYQLDPEDVEQLTLASFTPLAVKGWDRKRFERHIRIQQRKGRWMGLEVQDFGAWDLWLSTPWNAGRGEPLPGNLGFEAERYVVDATILRRGMKLEGTTRIDIRAKAEGRRAVTLELYRDLAVRSVIDERGRELFFFRSGNEVVVALPEPSEAGSQFSLNVTYGGRVLKWVGKETYDLESTDAWHPHCGTVDRATYDVTLRWPQKLDLIASGSVIAEGRDGKYRWERRTLDAPAIAFSFALGDFLIERETIGHVDLRIAFNRRSRSALVDPVRRQIKKNVAESLAFFEDKFGPYPLDELTVVMLPRAYSQSYLGFVTLTDSILLADDYLARRGLGWVREMTVAHEIAHQWWGNLVGWWSYRDQWLSEAMANYSALLFYSSRRDEPETILAEMSAGWRDSLSRSTAGGRTVESLGPIVLGARLDSSLASNGYRAIVYRKGAVVLAMLARIVGEEEFLGTLATLVGSAANEVVTTADFLSALENRSGVELDGFARRFVYGTGIPEIYYDYRREARAGGGWTMSGTVRQVAAPTYRHRITRREPGGWDVSREVHLADDASSTGFMVPYRLTLDGKALLPKGDRATTVRSGRVFIEGGEHAFEIESIDRPLELELDPREEILARFYPASRYPKRFARYRAHDLAIQGRIEEAERVYREALDTPSGAPAPNAADALWRSPDTEDQVANAGIHLALARLYIDRGSDAAAAAELDAVDALLDQDELTFRMERDALRSRLEVRRGEYEAAFKRLRKTLKLADPDRGPYTSRGVVSRVRLRSERHAMTEALCLLSVAALETGNREAVDWALFRARERRADVSAFAQELDWREQIGSTAR